MFNGGTVQNIKQNIAVHTVVRFVVPGAVFQQNMAIHAQFCRRRRRLPRVVGLRGPLGQHNVRAHSHGFSHQKLQLAGFIATGRQPRAIITLYPDLWPAKQC